MSEISITYFAGFNFRIFIQLVYQALRHIVNYKNAEFVRINLLVHFT